MHDPRRRNLVALLAAALVLSALAAIALWQQSARVSGKSRQEPFLPELLAQEDKVAALHIVSAKSGAFDVRFDPQHGWILPGRNNYPASSAQVRKTIVGLANLQTMEPRTARGSWLHYLDLDDPVRGGAGISISFLDEHGKTIAAIITGKTVDIGDATGMVGLFVRKPGSSQSWLARSPIEPSANPSEWAEKDVIGIDRSRIQETDVFPSSGPSYVVRREKPSDAEFTLLNPPKGRELTYESAPSGVAAAIVGFTFDDVRSQDSFDFSNPSRLVTKTFDGLQVTTEVISLGPDSWARLSAVAMPGHQDAEREARDIAARTHSWAYKLPAYKAQQFLTSLESLLKPAAAPARH